MDEALNFEEKIEKIKNILTQLSSPNLNLKEGVALYKEGFRELEQAQELLKKARLEYEEIKSKDQE